jgi:hypothetical protein
MIYVEAFSGTLLDAKVEVEGMAGANPIQQLL